MTESSRRRVRASLPVGLMMIYLRLDWAFAFGLSVPSSPMPPLCYYPHRPQVRTVLRSSRISSTDADDGDCADPLFLPLCYYPHRPPFRTVLRGGIISSTDADDGDCADPLLLPILRRALGRSEGQAISYDTLDVISQANAEGRRVSVHPSGDEGDEDEVELFVKTVDAARYAPAKAWSDLRRTLLYARTECRFYGEFLPLLSNEDEPSSHRLAPTCLLSEYDLSDLIDDNSRAADAAATIPAPPDYDGGSTCALLEGKGASIVLESLSVGSGSQVDDPIPAYYQESPLTAPEATICLDAAARLHAGAWGRTDLLRLARERLSLPVYTLSMRNPAELADLVDTWEDFVANFEPYLEQQVREEKEEGSSGELARYAGLFDRAGIRDLGRRMRDAAQYVSDQLDPDCGGAEGDSYAHVTLCHGDYKAMNVFLPRAEGGSAVMIDFASVGIGYGMMDVAMHLTHAVRPETLADGGEERLLEGYLHSLEREYARTKSGSSSGEGGSRSSTLSYPRDLAMRHYRLAVVDYFRFVCGRFWRGATPQAFEGRGANKNTVLVNRDVGAALAFIDRVDRYLRDFEAEAKEAEGIELGVSV